jgi:hypothetical protein
MSDGVTKLEREIRPVAVGAPGDACFNCSAPLAEDQRYCVNCGERRGEPRVPLLEERAAIPPPARAPEARGVRALLAKPMSVGAGLAGIGLVLLALLLGVVIGNSGNDKSSTPVAAARPQVITVATAGTGAGTSADQAFTSDWPDGTDGYTIQLQVLSKDSSDVAAVTAAKSGAQGKGAADVGALDSDGFASLDSGNYVVYSGVFDSKSAAKKALEKLKGNFPGAKVVQVSATGGSGAAKKVDKNQLKQLENSSPKDYQKKSKKLPDKLSTPGKAPPTDKKKAGGGSKEQTIG